MKRLPHTIALLLLLLATTSCDSYLINGPLDGMWQLQSIERHTPDTVIQTAGDLFYSFQRHSVLVGDYILAKNMDLGLSSGQYDLVSHVIKTMTTLCEGELIQSDHASKLDTSREAYFDIIYKKTASLLSASSSAGAISVGASQPNVAAMRRFGEYIGLAFQIRDDILDYTPTADTGKPSNNDLRERKITLPLIEVLERVSDEERAEIISLVERCATDERCVEQVQQRVVAAGGIEAATETMKVYLQRAMSILGGYEESPYRQALIDLCTYIAERNR